MTGSVQLAGRVTSRSTIVSQARKLATCLSECGVAPGGAVAILMRNDTTYLVAIEACRYLGSRFVPVNWHAAPGEIAAIVEDSGAAALLAHADLARGLEESLPRSCSVVCFAAPDEVGTAYPAIANAGAMPTFEEVLAPFVEWAAEPLPFLGVFAYTSGSTGRPKGIQRKPRPGIGDLVDTYRMLSSRFLDLRDGDKLYIAAPLYHSAPNGLALFGFYSNAADLVLAPKFDPEAFLRDVEEYRITHAYLVPTMMVRLLKLPAEVRERYDVSSLRFAFSSGSACPREVKAAMIEWLGPIIYESYGSSELGFMTLINSVEAAAKPGSVGKVLPGGSILILDDDMRELGAGESGAIYVDLPTIGDFDYSNSDGTLGNQRYKGHTTVGDIGYLDSEGFLFINDRKKDMIITGGANVFPAEIESVLFQMPQVMDCAVFGIPDPEFGEAIAVAVQCKDGHSLNLEDVHQFLSGKVARFKYPKNLQVLNELPREDSGKVFKKKLRDPFWEGKAVRV